MSSASLGDDAGFIRRAIALAMTGRGITEPNPSVGCVLVKDGHIIGQGRTQPPGANHAEPEALASCTQDPRGATAYVTLEPCCHTNKRTPPCCPRLIEAGVARVVVGTLDPNPDVNGNGITILRAAGIEVATGVLDRECNQLIAPFLATTLHKRPYITLKWAQTADRKIAAAPKRRLQISNETSSRAVHELRARCDAILTGIGTVIADDPLLTARGAGPSRLHSRIILDHRCRIPLDSQLVRTARDLDVEVFTTRQGYAATDPDRIRQLMSAGVYIVVKDPGVHGVLRLPEILQDIAKREVTHLLVEPGPTLAAGFFDANAADRLWIIESPTRLNDDTSPSAAPVPPDFIPVATANLAGDKLTEYLNPHSPVFFAPEPSADFALAAALGSTSAPAAPR